jgi:hypothetical protein
VAASPLCVVPGRTVLPVGGFVTILYNNDLYPNRSRGLFVMPVMMMMVLPPVPVLAAGGITASGYLVHLVFGQILQWRLVKRWFLRKHVTFLFFFLKLLSSHLF